MNMMMNPSAMQSKLSTKNILLCCAVALALLAVFLPETAIAGTGGTAFDDVWTTIKDWIQGTLGRIIAGSMILVGIVGGIARGSLMAFALGIAGGMGLYNSPTVVESIMSATLEVSSQMIPAAIFLTNGLM